MIASVCVIALSVMSLATFVIFLINQGLFRRLPRVSDSVSASGATSLPGVSVLIPARDEARRIQATLDHVLQSQHVDLEVIVLDDHSTDGTADIVKAIEKRDPRVRLESSAALPEGWSGKQFACLQLARHATHDELVFLDADVHVSPEAISRGVLARRQTGVALLSGFPKQITVTFGEALLIPMMFQVLLSYLPFPLMRLTNMVGASAGCGQWFIAERGAYFAMGGHEAVKDSWHDGVKLPRAFRKAGYQTDVYDASDAATCRMYESSLETWEGLRKNATEGIAHPRLIVPFTGLLLGGYVLPAILFVPLILSKGFVEARIVEWGLGAAWLPGLILAARGLAPWRFALLMPLAVTVFVALQWCALLGRSDRRASWKGRKTSVEGMPTKATSQEAVPQETVYGP